MTDPLLSHLPDRVYRWLVETNPVEENVGFPVNLPISGVSHPIMNTASLTQKFTRMGARLKVVETPSRRRRMNTGVSLDIQSDRLGEFFEMTQPSENLAEITVLDVQPRDRHLLLLVRDAAEKSKFLCGHDERHWFVAGIPESAPVGTIRQAKEALKPAEVIQAQSRQGLRSRQQHQRKNAAFIRQGEWFFLPAPEMVVNPKLVLSWEPISRGGGGKPHWVEFLYRTGGETVYVCSRYPNGLLAREYQALISSNRNAKNWGWRIMKRNPGVYVRGRVRHPDHATITLHGWHRVVMNTEGQARAMQHIAFLD